MAISSKPTSGPLGPSWFNFRFARHPLAMASAYGASAFTQGIRQAASQRAGRGHGNEDLSGAT
jgi:hypothetical protein